MDRIKKIYKYSKDFGLFYTLLSLYIWVTSRCFKKNNRQRVKKILLSIEKRKFLAEYDEKTKTGNILTFLELKKWQKKYPNYLGAYYQNRWEYMKVVIDIIKREAPKKILELGPYRLPLVKGADLMDKNLCGPELTYQHDATKFPWPIENSKYDCFVALGVWEHLENSQQQVFKEVMRTARMAVISFPYKCYCPGDCHHNIGDKEIAGWTLFVKPEQIIKVGSRIIYFFKFRP